MLLNRLPGKQRGIFYGWKVLAAAGWLRALGGGFHSAAFSILFLPVSRDLNLSRTTASLIFSLSRAEGALEGPFAGYVIDRLGARIVTIIGCLVVGVGYLLLSWAYDFTSFVLIYILVICVGFGSAFMHSAAALVNHWFFRHRALGLAIISASMSLGSAIFAPVFGFVVHQFGWRAGAIMSGAVFLVLGLPITRLIHSTPESKGEIPLGAPKPAAGISSSPQVISYDNGDEFTVRQALRTTSFWLLVSGAFLRMVGLSAMSIHFIPILTWKGVAEQSAAYYLAMMGAFSVPVTIGLGLAGDRWFRPRILSLGMALGTVGLLFLLLSRNVAQFLFIPSLALVDALFPVLWATVGDFFGRRNFASIRGYVTLFATPGSILGPIFAGMIFDQWGDYTLAIQISLASFAFSALMFWLLHRPNK